MAHDIRALSREWFEEVWNKRDDAAIERLASSLVQAQGLGANGEPAQGFEQFRQFRQAMLSAFPDMMCTVQDVLVDEDQTAVRLTFSGTHSGNGIGIAPTGRAFLATAIVMLRWSNGKIIEAWNEFDEAGMMRQLQSPAAKLRV